LPELYLKALARLQDSVKPFPYAEVEQIVESELGAHLEGLPALRSRADRRRIARPGAHRSFATASKWW
jgi:predicted unusual protein kinase regulating ubiquinone biosynthesis (AarF/ABC1/UbiB family)